MTYLSYFIKHITDPAIANIAAELDSRWTEAAASYAGQKYPLATRAFCR